MCGLRMFSAKVRHQIKLQFISRQLTKETPFYFLNTSIYQRRLCIAVVGTGLVRTID